MLAEDVGQMYSDVMSEMGLRMIMDDQNDETLNGNKSHTITYDPHTTTSRNQHQPTTKPKDTESGISNFMLTVYAVCTDGSIKQTYEAEMKTRNLAARDAS